MIRRLLKCYHEHLPDKPNAYNRIHYHYDWFWRIRFFKWKWDIPSKPPKWVGSSGYSYDFEEVEYKGVE